MLLVIFCASEYGSSHARGRVQTAAEKKQTHTTSVALVLLVIDADHRFVPSGRRAHDSTPPHQCRSSAVAPRGGAAPVGTLDPSVRLKKQPHASRAARTYTAASSPHASPVTAGTACGRPKRNHQASRSRHAVAAAEVVTPLAAPTITCARESRKIMRARRGRLDAHQQMPHARRRLPRLILPRRHLRRALGSASPAAGRATPRPPPQERLDVAPQEAPVGGGGCGGERRRHLQERGAGGREATQEMRAAGSADGREGRRRRLLGGLGVR